VLVEDDLATSQTSRGLQTGETVAKPMPEPFLATLQTSQTGSVVAQIAERAIALAALTDEQKQQRLDDPRRDPAIARFWALVWPASQTPPKEKQ
jgi:hypothetical protein